MFGLSNVESARRWRDEWMDGRSWIIVVGVYKCHVICVYQNLRKTQDASVHPSLSSTFLKPASRSGARPGGAATTPLSEAIRPAPSTSKSVIAVSWGTRAAGRCRVPTCAPAGRTRRALRGRGTAAAAWRSSASACGGALGTTQGRR